MWSEVVELTDDTTSEPYVNGIQEWFGESEAAGRVLAGWFLISLIVLSAGLLRYGLLVAGTGGVSLLVSSLIQFWRDELAPEMRHSRGDSNV